MTGLCGGCLLLLLFVYLCRASAQGRYERAKLEFLSVPREDPSELADLSTGEKRMYRAFGRLLPVWIHLPFDLPSMHVSGAGTAHVASRFPGYADAFLSDHVFTNHWENLAAIVGPARLIWSENVVSNGPVRLQRWPAFGEAEFRSYFERLKAMRAGIRLARGIVVYDLHSKRFASAGQTASELAALLAAFDAASTLDLIVEQELLALVVSSAWELLMYPEVSDLHLHKIQSRLSSAEIAKAVSRMLVNQCKDRLQEFDECMATGTVLYGMSTNSGTGVVRVLGETACEAVLSGFDRKEMAALRRASEEVVWIMAPAFDDVIEYLARMKRLATESEKAVQAKNWSRVPTLSMVPSAYRMTASELPSILPVIQRSFLAESSKSVAVVAIALERYRRKFGAYPDSLNRLIPDYLNEVPVDWMNGKPVRYRLEEDGQFRLWSVGEDGIDAGGISSGGTGWMRGVDMVWPRAATASEVTAYIAERRAAYDRAVAGRP